MVRFVDIPWEPLVGGSKGCGGSLFKRTEGEAIPQPRKRQLEAVWGRAPQVERTLCECDRDDCSQHAGGRQGSQLSKVPIHQVRRCKKIPQHLGNLIEERRLPAADLVLCFVLEQSVMVSGLSNSEGPVHGIDASRCADTTGLIRRM
jgi:hypothetical protein